MTAPSPRVMTADLAAVLATLSLSDRRVYLRVTAESAPGSLMGQLMRGLAAEVVADIEREEVAFAAMTSEVTADLAAERQIRARMTAVMRDGSHMRMDPDSGQWYRID